MTLIKNGLLYFKQAIEDGSIRKAADRLQVASSAVNRQLLQLEAGLGVELFEHLPRGIRPTAAGELLLLQTQEWIRDTEKLRQDIGRLKGGTRGTIHIAAAESITTEILPQAIARLQIDYPGIDFNLISGDNFFIKSALLAKEADLVCAFDITGTSRTETITSIKAPIGVLMHPDHALAKQDRVSIADCLEHPIIAPTQTWLNHSTLKRLFENPDLPFQITARVERVGMLRNLVHSGLGIAFISPLGLRQDIQDRKLAWVPLTREDRIPTIVSLLVPKGRMLANYTRQLIHLLKTELEAQANLID